MKKQDFEAQKIAKSQYGAIGWPQAERLGFNRLQIKRRVRAGDWVRVVPDVWRLSWVEPTWMQRVWCAWLWGATDALISHRAAARLWELDGMRSDDVELMAPKRLRVKGGWFRAHQSPGLPRVERQTKSGLALTSPSRTLVDLAGIVDEAALQRAVEHAFRRKIASMSSLWRALGSVPAQGRAGTGTLTRLLQAEILRPELQSELERQVCSEQANRPTVSRKFFAWSPSQVHSGRRAWERDIARYNRLQLRGWTLLRVTQGDLDLDGGEEFVGAVRAALRLESRG